MFGFGLRKKSRGDSAPISGSRPKNISSRPLVVCDDCGFEFEMILKCETAKITEDRIGLCRVRYLHCPKCDKVGVVNIVDSSLFKLDKESIDAQSKLQTLKRSGTASEIQIEIAQKELRLKNDMAARRAKYLMDNFKHKFIIRKTRNGKKIQFVPEQ